MTVETGQGVKGADAYVTVAFVDSYLALRGRTAEGDWSGASTAEKEAAVVAATDYIDTRWGARFVGTKRYYFYGDYATATLTLAGAPADGETLTVVDETFTFLDSPDSGDTYQVQSGDVDELVSAINSYSRHVSAEADGLAVTLTARTPGYSGNFAVVSTTLAGATIGSFSGGEDYGPQRLCWPRLGVYLLGLEIVGVPEEVRRACAEYAVRARVDKLSPDPTVDDYAGRVKRRREDVGPIREETEYDFGSQLSIVIRPYPEADRLLRPFVTAGGTVYR